MYITNAKPKHLPQSINLFRLLGNYITHDTNSIVKFIFNIIYLNFPITIFIN